MLAFAFRPKKQVVAFFVAVSFFAIASFYFTLEGFFEAASEELVSSWYSSERTTIQQGNALTSASKLQRSLAKSSILSGISIFDDNGHNLFKFGSNLETPTGVVPTNELKSTRIGSFKRLYYFSEGKLTFYIYSRSTAFYFLLVALVIYAMSLVSIFGFVVRNAARKEEEIKREIVLREINIELELNKRIADLSKRLAHDIRSPLSVLNILGQRLTKNSKDDGELLNAAAVQINKIASDLLEGARDLRVPQITIMSATNIEKKDMTYLKVDELARVCKEAVEMKKIEFQSRQGIRLGFFNALTESSSFVSAELVDLKRILSNILNNAVQAIKAEGFVILSIDEIDDELSIEIRDSGCGISQQHLKDILNSKMSSSKPDGHGIGVSSAIEVIESWGGTFSIVSKENHGTSVSLRFKKNSDFT